MFEKTLLLIYRLFLSNGRRRVNLMDMHFGVAVEVPLSSDEQRNEQKAYATLFSQRGKKELKRIYEELLEKTNGVPYQQSRETLDMLIVMQAVTTGKIVGKNGTASVFEVAYNGSNYYIAIGVGSNGYIVRANPVSQWSMIP